MSTITSLKAGDTTAGLGVSATAQPALVSVRIRAADAVTSKGSALAANDLIAVATIPANTSVGNATYNVLTADSGTTLTIDLGTTSVADEFVDGNDCTATGVAAAGTNGVFSQRILYTTADVLYLKVATASSASDDWEIEVFFEVCDYTSKPRGRAAKDNP